MYLGFFHRSCSCTMVLPTFFQKRFGNTSSLSLTFFHVLSLYSYSSFLLIFFFQITIRHLDLSCCLFFCFFRSQLVCYLVTSYLRVVLFIYITFILLSSFLVYSKNLLLPYTYSCRLLICCPLNLLLRSWHWSK